MPKKVTPIQVDNGKVIECSPITLDLKIKNKKNKNEYIKYVDTNLYFRHMGGAGTIYCCDCQYSEEITSHLHGIEFDDYGFEIEAYSSGYQCQSCSKFYTLHYNEVKELEESDKQCECGGKLEDDKPILCPQCKSKKVEYYCRIIT